MTRPFISLYGTFEVGLYGTKYSRMAQVRFVEDSLYKIWKDIGLL